jgi:hypothetical protein
MAQLIITVQRNPDEGGLLVRVGLQSDTDALPCEHEARHRQLVAALFPSATDVRRERPAREASVG